MTDSNWQPGNPKWHPSIMSDVEHYIDTSKDMTIKGLCAYLDISRQCLYNWTCRHERLKLLVMDMKCKGIFNMPMWGDEKRNKENFNDL